MRRSMHLLCAAAVGLAACGSKDDLTNLANSAANDAKAAGTNAGEAAKEAANSANETVTNTADEAGGAVTNAADEAGGAVTNATDATGGAYGKAQVGPVAGKGPPARIKLNLKKVGFVGCSRRFMESKIEPKPGVCVIVRSERATYDTYDISSAKPLPNLARAIAGTGFYLPNQHGVCMAGPKVLSGVKWHYIKGQCVKGKLKS